ncbi:MAG: ABC transporter ATP-binding protein/permease [Anaerolineae bacterium]|nr:ABC transporter ATP-binding protein/permease [Anaerolineae bacterium]
MSDSQPFSVTLKLYRALLGTYLSPLRRQIVLLAVLLFGSIGLQLWTPQILRQFIDTAQRTAAQQTAAQGSIGDQSGGVPDVLLRKAVLFFALVVIGRVVQVGATYVTQNVRWRATNRMRGDLAGHCLGLDMPFHNEQTPGSIIERIDGDVDVLSNFFSQFVLQVVGNAALLMGILVLLFREDWRIGVTFLVFVSLVAWVLVKSVSITAPLWKAQRQASSELFGFLEERLSGTEDIRANGAVAYVLRGLQKAVSQLYVRSQKAFMLSVSLNWGFSEGMLALGTVLALALGGYLMLQGRLTIGAVYLVFHYNTMLQWPLNQLARQLRDLQSATGSIERIQELFNTASKVQDPDPAQAQPLPAGALTVHFDAVTFRYEDDDPILKELSWRLGAGEVLGILGRTGSGKTTSTRLLCRLYDPEAGAVRVGGVDLRHVPIDDLRRRVGIVTQDVQLFEATVRENLTLFDDSISDDTILSVVDELGLGTWLEDLPDGLDTELQGNSAGLSAGEAQLLAFTRVFLRDPGLVILDEASSRLDPLTERLMERAIDHLFRGRTAVIVAHRLATVQRATKIMILEDGHIVEYGDRLSLAADPLSRFSHLLHTGLEEVLV